MVSKNTINRSFVVASTPSAIVAACRDILTELKARSFSEDDTFAVHLALEEAFINAIKHGNKMNSAKQVKIDYLVGLDKIEVFLADQGDGFDPDAVVDPRAEENLYKTEGRGLFLIRSYMDEVDFNERGNRMRMVKYRS